MEMGGRLMTRDDMVEWVKARLGAPLTDIEMVVEENKGLGHIHMAIQDCLDLFWKFSVDEASYQDLLILHLEPGVMEYRVPDEVMQAVDVTPSYGNTFSPMMAVDIGPGESLLGVGGIGLGGLGGMGLGQFDLPTYVGALRYLADMKKTVGTQYDIHFYPDEHIIRVYPTPKTPRKACARVFVKAKMSSIFLNPIFREMAVAKAKMQLGEIVGKDDFTMPGNVKIDGKWIYSEGEKRFDKYFDLMLEQAPGAMMMTDLS